MLLFGIRNSERQNPRNLEFCPALKSNLQLANYDNESIFKHHKTSDQQDIFRELDIQNALLDSLFRMTAYFVGLGGKPILLLDTSK